MKKRVTPVVGVAVAVLVALASPAGVFANTGNLVADTPQPHEG